MHFIHAVLDDSDSLIGYVSEIMNSIPKLSSSKLHFLFPLGHRIICVYAKLDERFFDERCANGTFMRGSSADIQMNIFSIMCNELKTNGWMEISATISDQSIQDTLRSNKVSILHMLAQIFGMTYLLYCSSLGIQYFLHYLVEKQSFWFYPFAATYLITQVVFMFVLDKLGYYKEQLNNVIVILSASLALMTAGYIF